MENSQEPARRRAKRREILPTFFVVVLIGIAYQEMVSAVRDSVRSHGFSFGTMVLFVVFFLTAMRFFVGNELHLQSEEVQAIKGGAWFFDLMVIVLQTTLIMFLGGLASLEASAESPVGFFWLLIALYAVDVLWVLVQGLTSRWLSAWHRSSVPWKWGALNSVLILTMLLVYCFADGFYGNAALAVLGILNALAFVIDLVWIDAFNMI